MLEKLIFIANQHSLKEVSEELVEARNGSYEPVYPFKNSNGPLPVDQEIVDFIIWKLHNPTSKAQYEKLEELQEKEEVGYFEEEIGKDERSPLFVFENSAWVSTNQVKFRQTYVEKSKEAPSGIVV
jgi:competence CoiA-like predicted nuclease